MSKLIGFGKTHRKPIRCGTENFPFPFTTYKLFERIQKLNELKFHRNNAKQIITINSIILYIFSLELNCGIFFNLCSFTVSRYQ